jgi:hypothetical protein
LKVFSAIIPDQEFLRFDGSSEVLQPHPPSQKLMLEEEIHNVSTDDLPLQMQRKQQSRMRRLTDHTVSAE